MSSLDTATRTELEAAAFRRLLRHLDENKDVQNIDLMILADFCRNCLSKWLVTAAEEPGNGSTACPMPNGRKNTSNRPRRSSWPRLMRRRRR